MNWSFYPKGTSAPSEKLTGMRTSKIADLSPVLLAVEGIHPSGKEA